MHHTECGMQSTDDVSFADLVEKATGRRPPWAARVFTDVDDDVRESMRLIKECPYLLSTEVRGTVYDVETGLLREVICRAPRRLAAGPCSGPRVGVVARWYRDRLARASRLVPACRNVSRAR